MLRRIGVGAVSVLLLVSLCGCVALLAGAAGGAGTSVWLGGKLSQTVDASYDRTITASRKALESLDLPVNKETRGPDVTQFKSTYTDGKEIWVDVRRISEKATKVEVRVGGVEADKVAADKILTKIQANL